MFSKKRKDTVWQVDYKTMLCETSGVEICQSAIKLPNNGLYKNASNFYEFNFTKYTDRPIGMFWYIIVWEKENDNNTLSNQSG